MANYLPFEEPIHVIEEEIQKAIGIETTSGVSTAKMVKDLERKLKETTEEIYKNLTPWQRVQLSRHPDRPYTLDYIKALTGGNFVEFHGDRNVKDDKAMVGGFGTIDGETVMFVGQQKGQIQNFVNTEILECLTQRVIEKLYVYFVWQKNLINQLLR